jgi:hypothetical protein
MKKNFLLLTMLAFAIGLSAQNNMTLDKIHDNWQSKSIEVEDASPANILELVSAFQQVWPTYSGSELIKFSLSDEEYYNTDKVIDLKNGFVRYSEDDPEAESDEGLEACLWRRKNGHGLMAITFYRMTPSELVVLCFYDYDPKTNTLTPEKNLVNLFEPSFSGYRHRVLLPQKGKILVINEYFGSITIEHSYGWDGMKPTNPKVTIDRLDNCQAQFNADYFGGEDHPFTQYSMLDIDHDGRPELVLRADDESFRAVYSIALTTSLLAGENGSRFLSFYNNAVCHSGSCGALCMSSVYVMLKESSVKSYLTDTSEWDMQLDSYGDSVFTLDGKEISKEEAEKMLRTLGEAYEPDLKWTRMAVD